ncbi:hypothetical protein VPH35_131001 [Triticum aestivum]
MAELLLLVAVAWVLLLAGHGTNAARLAKQVTRPGATKEGYYGFIATMDVYGFNLSSNQLSTGAILLYDQGDARRPASTCSTLARRLRQGGYGDSLTHLGVGWTTDGYQKTGCPNPSCTRDFIPEQGAPIAAGGVIETVSQLNGPKQYITIKIIKDGIMGDWMVYYGLNQDKLALIGRFPKTLFTGGLANRAADIQVGGHVLTSMNNLAPMGSGYLPIFNAMSSASMSNVQFIDQNGHALPMNQISLTYITDSNIYAVGPIVNGQFFYGGPFQLST